jgi:D-serine deaminase-like pyridoxal phosphate-dependent protein
MLISSKNFTLKILSSRFSQKSNILIRLIHEVFCDVLIDATMLKSDKEKSLREKSEDIVLFITMTIDKVHIYDETEELTNRADVC